ncbi:hypothetical protein NQZ68_026535 [Dissostichus eleginoides]|nr:hypothetical protein NQZ68_026535 [Dissostichus eleginoides]
MIWTERLFKVGTDKREGELLCSGVLQRPSPQGGVSARLAVTGVSAPCIPPDQFCPCPLWLCLIFPKTGLLFPLKVTIYADLFLLGCLT